MGISKEIQHIKPGEDLHRCPACGYEYGFHTSFVSTSAKTGGQVNPVKSTKELYRVILICPECGARYDVGWRVSFGEEESPVILTATLPR